MKTALVTGGAGFMGSHVAEHLRDMGMQVVVLDDLSGGFHRNVPNGCELCVGSVENRELIEDLFRKHRFQFVYHLAAYAAEGLSHFIRDYNYRVNLLGSINLINAAVNHGTECFVFTSSAAVYGSASGQLTEEMLSQPIDPYGIAKLAIEHDLRAATAMWGMRHVIFRPHNVYGERQNLADPFRNVIGIFMKQVLAGQPCSIFGDGTQTRGFTHISDVAPIIAKSATLDAAQNQTFNVGASEVCALNDLAEKVQAALQRQVGIVHLPPRHEAKHISCDHSRVDQVFGCSRLMSLDDGLRRMAAWAQTVDISTRPPVAPIDVDRGIPAVWENDVFRKRQN